MKTWLTAATLTLAAFSLTACGGKDDDSLGDQAARTADNQADAMEATADNLEDQAEAVRERGEEREEAIDDADVNAQALSNGQKAAIVNGAAEIR